MFWSRAHYLHPEFKIGLRDMASQVPGIAAWGLVTGVAMVEAGMSPLEAVLMTVLVYAGSSQLAAIPLLAAGAPASVIVATAFCVNLRFVVFSLHLRPYLMHLPRWKRLATGYLTADLSYVAFTRRFPHPAAEAAQQHAQDAYLAGNCHALPLKLNIVVAIGAAVLLCLGLEKRRPRVVETGSAS